MSINDFTEMVGMMKHAIDFCNEKVKGKKQRVFEVETNNIYAKEDDLILDYATKAGLLNKATEKDILNIEYPIVYSLTKDGFEFLSKITNVEIIEED